MSDSSTAILDDISPQEIAEACAKVMWENDRTSHGLGMELNDVAPGAATVTMEIQDFMVNGHGTCHGGYIYTFAGSAFAIACNTYNQAAVIQHGSITYMAPGLVGDMLTATAREINKTGRSGIYDICVTKQDGTVIAEFRGHARFVKGTHLDKGD